LEDQANLSSSPLHAITEADAPELVKTPDLIKEVTFCLYEKILENNPYLQEFVRINYYLNSFYQNIPKEGKNTSFDSKITLKTAITILASELEHQDSEYSTYTQIQNSNISQGIKDKYSNLQSIILQTSVIYYHGSNRLKYTLIASLLTQINQDTEGLSIFLLIQNHLEKQSFSFSNDIVNYIINLESSELERLVTSVSNFISGVSIDSGQRSFFTRKKGNSNYVELVINTEANDNNHVEERSKSKKERKAPTSSIATSLNLVGLEDLLNRVELVLPPQQEDTALARHREIVEPGLPLVRSPENTTISYERSIEPYTYEHNLLVAEIKTWIKEMIPYECDVSSLLLSDKEGRKEIDLFVTFTNSNIAFIIEVKATGGEKHVTNIASGQIQSYHAEACKAYKNHVIIPFIILGPEIIQETNKQSFDKVGETTRHDSWKDFSIPKYLIRLTDNEEENKRLISRMLSSVKIEVSHEYKKFVQRTLRGIPESTHPATIQLNNHNNEASKDDSEKGISLQQIQEKIFLPFFQERYKTVRDVIYFILDLDIRYVEIYDKNLFAIERELNPIFDFFNGSKKLTVKQIIDLQDQIFRDIVINQESLTTFRNRIRTITEKDKDTIEILDGLFTKEAFESILNNYILINEDAKRQFVGKPSSEVELHISNSIVNKSIVSTILILKILSSIPDMNNLKRKKIISGNQRIKEPGKGFQL
jgi:hypothetical protein